MIVGLMVPCFNTLWTVHAYGEQSFSFLNTNYVLKYCVYSSMPWWFRGLTGYEHISASSLKSCAAHSAKRVLIQLVELGEYFQ